MDVKRLTLAPWLVDNWDEVTFKWLLSPNGRSDREFIAMARNAFDVMMRRGWYCHPTSKGWICYEDEKTGPGRMTDDGGCSHALNDMKAFSDPFTALVAADEWMKKKERQT